MNKELKAKILFAKIEYEKMVASGDITSLENNRKKLFTNKRKSLKLILAVSNSFRKIHSLFNELDKLAEDDK